MPHITHWLDISSGQNDWTKTKRNTLTVIWLHICCVWLKRSAFDQLFMTDLKETAEQGKNEQLSNSVWNWFKVHTDQRTKKGSTAAPNLINTVRSELRLLWQILSLEELQLFSLDESVPNENSSSPEYPLEPWVLLWKVVWGRMPSPYPVEVDTIINFLQNQH